MLTAATSIERVRQFWLPYMHPETRYEIDPDTCEHDYGLIGPSPDIAGPVGTGCRKCGWMKAWDT